MAGVRELILLIRRLFLCFSLILIQIWSLQSLRVLGRIYTHARPYRSPANLSFKLYIDTNYPQLPPDCLTSIEPDSNSQYGKIRAKIKQNKRMKQEHLFNNPKSKSGFSTHISSVVNHKATLLYTESGERAQQKMELRTCKAEVLQA